MSLLPYIMRDMSRSLRMLENQFRFADEVFHPFSSPFFRSLPNQLNNTEENYSIVQDKDKFEVKLDVQSFKPEEIVVKTVDNNAIQIEAKQNSKSEGGGIASKYFARIFVLPQGHDLKDVVSSLSSSGVLTVTAPRKPEAEEIKERVIPISHTEAKEETAKLEEKKSE